MPDKLLKTLSQLGLQDSRLDALASLAEDEGFGVDSSVLDKALLGEEDLLEALSAASGLKPVNLNHFYPDFSLAKLLLPEWCQQHGCVPLCEEDEALHVAVAYPPQLEALEEFSLRVGRKLLPWIAIECRIQQWLSTLYGLPLSPQTEKLLGKLSQAKMPPSPPSEGALFSTDNSEGLPADNPPAVPSPPALSTAASATAGDNAASSTSADASPSADASTSADASPSTDASSATDASPSAEGKPLLPQHPPKHSGSNVFRDFFVKITRQLFQKREEVSAPDTQAPASLSSSEMPEKSTLSLETLASQEVELAPQPQTLSQEVLVADTPPSEMLPSETPPSEALPSEMLPLETSPSEALPSETLPSEMPQASFPTQEESAAPTSFAAVDDGLPVETWLEELLADVGLPHPPAEKEGAALSPAPPQKEVDAPPPILSPPKEGLGQNEIPWVISFKNSSSTKPALHWTLDEAREQLRLAQKDRDALTTVLLRFGLCTFEFLGLFAVIHGKAQGFSCAGKGAQEGFWRTHIDLATPGLFHSIASTMSAYFGPPPNEPTLQHFLLAIHRRPRSIFIFPIAVGDKLVAILYGDSGQNPLKQKQFADFTLFCQQLPAAFHELLWMRRNPALPPELDETARQERIAHAITWLLEADAATQNAALEILGHTPEASARVLIQFFPGPHSNLFDENENAASLHSLGPVSHALLQLRDAGARVLTPLLFSKNRKLRCAALKLAGVFASAEHLEPVLLALSDLDPKIAAIARAALPHFKTLNEWPKALRLIQNSLNASDPLRRTLAAKAVAAAKDRNSIETLIEWTGDADAWIAETAAWALQQLSCVQLGPSPNLWRRWWARAQKERRAQWLVLALESESLEQRQQAICELSDAIGDNFQFVAHAPAEERLPAVQRWQQFVAQNPSFEL